MTSNMDTFSSTKIVETDYPWCHIHKEPTKIVQTWIFCKNRLQYRSSNSNRTYPFVIIAKSIMDLTVRYLPFYNSCFDIWHNQWRTSRVDICEDGIYKLDKKKIIIIIKTYSLVNFSTADDNTGDTLNGILGKMCGILIFVVLVFKINYTLINISLKFSFLQINCQQAPIGSDNGLAPKRLQSVSWTRDYPVHRCIYASPSLNMLRIQGRITSPLPCTIIMSDNEGHPYSLLFSIMQNQVLSDC